MLVCGRFLCCGVPVMVDVDQICFSKNPADLGFGMVHVFVHVHAYQNLLLLLAPLLYLSYEVSNELLSRIWFIYPLLHEESGLLGC